VTHDVSQATTEARQEVAQSIPAVLESKYPSIPLGPLLTESTIPDGTAYGQFTSEIGPWDGLLTDSDQSRDDDHFDKNKDREAASPLDDLEFATCIEVLPDLDGGGGYIPLVNSFSEFEIELLIPPFRLYQSYPHIA
jgi:hypothetical protein